MDLSNFINYVYTSSQNTNYKLNENIELEIRFGKYSSVSSNINIKTFAQIYQLGQSNKKFTLIKEKIFISKVKERNVFADTGEIKQLFGNLTKLITDESPLEDKLKHISESITKNKPIDSHFMIKDRLKKNINGVNYKIALLSEKLTNNNPEPKKSKITANRYKFRCNWLNKMWIYDATILFYCNPNNPKQCGAHFEVELEYDHKSSIKGNYTQNQVIECAMQHIRNITTIIDCNSTKINNLSTNIKYGMHNSVATLERQSLTKLTNSAYSLCDKADGERKFIYINNKGCVFHINPTDSMMTQIPIKSTKAYNMQQIPKNTLLDCELIDNKTFYGFDLLFYENNDYRNYNLSTRINLMKNVITFLSKINTQYEYKSKTFYMVDIFKNAKLIWEKRKKMFPYELDGLIFTPIRGNYLGHLPILKWKNLHSIDVRVMYNKRDNFSEFYANAQPIVKNIKGKNITINEYKDHTTGKIYYKSRVTLHNPEYKKWGLVNKHGVLGMQGKLSYDNQEFKNMVDIIEVEFLPNERKWKYLRTRPDKERANSFLSIKSVMEAVVGNVTIDTLANLKYNPSIYENIGSQYSNCFSDVGFNFLIPDDNSLYPMCQFYKHVYKNILNTAGKSNTKNSRILVLGGDKCLLHALIQSSYTNIYIIENNCLEVYGRIESEGYQGLLQKLEKSTTNNKNITIVWGDPITMTPYNKEDVKLINSDKYDTVWVNSFESLLYNKKTKKFDQDMFNKSINNIRKITKSLVGLFLSGSRIANYMTKFNCIVLKDSKFNPMYKLYANNVKAYLNADIFKCNPQMVEIQRVRNNFHTECQPIVYDKNIQDVLKSQKFKIKLCKTIKYLYNIYKKNNPNNKLFEYDCIIADITKFFIASL
jgi:hypothetical protein